MNNLPENMDSDNRIALLSINSTSGVGNRRTRDLVEMFGSPLDVINAPAGEISEAMKVKLSVGREIVSRGKNQKEAEKCLNKLDSIDAQVVTIWDDKYPSRLKLIDNPPVILFVKGEDSPLYDYSVAIVGTRVPGDNAKRITTRIANELSLAGVTVVSGMALGIDSLAHEGALRGGGRTIAVLGSGIDVIYPPSNRKLYERICKQGMIVSEYRPGVTPEPHHFPQRNRIISGLCLGAVIVEAGLKSGALITARYAIEQGRELFAVPGAAGMPRSAGVNRLLKDGTATLIESGKEVIEHMHSQLAPVLNVSATLTLPELSDLEAVIYNLLEQGPLQIDELIRQSKIGVVEVNRIMTSMQLKGLLRRYPGARVGRT
ncbi:MAG: DNA-protecting protein DprA [Calditrichaeota bacterium]|nr:DNA-protecting protein DprA [Calditrichota bacterium]